jgi:hypothetical protein
VNSTMYQFGPYLEVKRNGVKQMVHITETNGIERREAISEVKDEHEKIIRLQNLLDWAMILITSSDENYYRELDKNCKAREMCASYLYRPNWNDHIKSGEKSFVEKVYAALADDQSDGCDGQPYDFGMGLTE